MFQISGTWNVTFLIKPANLWLEKLEVGKLKLEFEITRIFETRLDQSSSSFGLKKLDSTHLESRVADVY